MKPEQVLKALEIAASKVGLRVRYEALPPDGVLQGGGLARVRSEWHLFINRKASVSERVQILTDTLAGFDTTALELPPRVRETLAASSRRKPVIEPQPPAPAP